MTETAPSLNKFHLRYKCDNAYYYGNIDGGEYDSFEEAYNKGVERAENNWTYWNFEVLDETGKVVS
jgi:flavin-binding protein dodecin